MRKSMIRVCSLALVLSILPVCEKPSAIAETQSNEDPNQVMITYKSNQKEIKTVEVPNGKSTTDFIDKLEEQPNVVNVEPDYTMKRSTTVNDPYYSQQWYHQMIGTEGAWNVTKGSKDIIVAVIDDGIDFYHRDLSGKIISPYDVVYGSKSIPAGEHGTHVSGIIASTMNNGLGGVGIAPNVKIMPINVFDGDSAYYSDVINGIQYAIDHGADIINLSLGGTVPSLMLDAVIQKAYKSGILVVAAAGNDGENVYDYPAAYNHVLAVSATDNTDQLAYFSNYGADIDLAAPGMDIYSTLPNNQYGLMSGTSMATPVVAGVAALVWSANSSFTNDQIENQLYKTADDLGPSGKDIYYGYGRINASKAVKVLVKAAVPKVTVDKIGDADTRVTVKFSTITHGMMTIYTKDRILATRNLANSNTLIIPIPKQKAGTKVFVKINNPTIQPIEVTVIDRTPPTAPVVNKITSNSTYVIGKAEKGTTVYVYKGKTYLGKAAVSTNGTFKVRINKQKNNIYLTVYAMDQAKNQSNKRSVKVYK